MAVADPTGVFRDSTVHASRTLMVGDLTALLDAAPGGSLEEYERVILAGNVLQRKSASARSKTLGHLRNLYALDERAPVFSALQFLAEAVAERPVGSVVAADFVYEQLTNPVIMSGVLLKEAHETIQGQRRHRRRHAPLPSVRPHLPRRAASSGGRERRRASGDAGDARRPPRGGHPRGEREPPGPHPGRFERHGRGREAHVPRRRVPPPNPRRSRMDGRVPKRAGADSRRRRPHRVRPVAGTP